MEFWNNIVNTALLGTDKRQVSSNELPAEIAEVYEQLATNETLDKEEKFLQITSVAFNYRQCGSTLFLKEDFIFQKAPAETKAYCNAKALQVLSDILQEQSYSLLEFWLQHCYKQQQIVLPEMIPTLFGIAANKKNLSIIISQCCGERGLWLSGFNPEWNFYTLENDDDAWQNGTAEQRKKVIKKLHQADPAKAREWLQQTWSSENANAKAELMKQLATSVTEDDVAWLESLQEEKSQKIKDVVLTLLKQIPASSIVTSYRGIVEKSITLKKEKAFLGMINKTALHIQLPGIHENIFKTGIEKLSNTKEFTDEEFVIFQLMQFNPPENYETHFNSSPEQVISYFQKEKATQKFLGAIVDSIITFKNNKWATAFMQHSDEFYSGIISVLTEDQQDRYSLNFFDKEPDNIIRLAKERESEWSVELTKEIFKHTAKQMYQYNRAFYNECINLTPATIVGELETCTPQEDHFKNAWSNMSEYIGKLISLKSQTIQAFQSSN